MQKLSMLPPDDLINSTFNREAYERKEFSNLRLRPCEKSSEPKIKVLYLQKLA